MERYSIDIEKKAKKQLAEIHKSGNKTDIKKIEQIFKELEKHPKKGVGSPKQMRHELSCFWSRDINKKDRILYHIDEEKITITIVSARGHYYDK